ncbi:Retrovirus-related Pol polyprotein from transposon RE1 [Linum perenne]
MFNDLEWKCPEDGAQYRNVVDTNRIFKFLSGLNVELDDVRGRIVGRNHLPSIGEVFAEVRREETRRGVMLGKKPDVGVEKSALQVTREGFGARQKGADPKAHLKCDYCGKPRHTRETCWKLNGKPPHLKNPRANAANLGEGGLLSKEQLEQIMALLQPHNSVQGNSTASLAQSGNDSLALSAHSKLPVWILDSGASDHMTNSSLNFSTYIPLSGSQKITVANGNSVPVAGKGHISLSSELILKSVLHVPKLDYNLLSIRRLTHESNCVVVFYPFHCAIQDLSSGKMIGKARLRDGLYYLDMLIFQNICGGKLF